MALIIKAWLLDTLLTEGIWTLLQKEEHLDTLISKSHLASFLWGRD